jgi:predicted PurR-regulated permease PerM
MERRWRFLVSLAALVVIVAGMKAAGALLAPVVFGLMVAAISAPGVIWLARHGVPALFGALFVLVLDIGIVGLFGGLLYVAAGDVQRRVPMYLDQFSVFMASIGHSLTRMPTGRARIASAHADRMGAWITDLAERVAGIATDATVVLFVVFFVLWELTVIGDKFRAHSQNAPQQLVRIDRIVREMQKYLLVKVLTSTIAAGLVFLVLRAFRIELALFLALLLFVLHFVPNIGAAIAMIPAVLVVFADRGPGAALTVGIAYLVINTIVGNLLEPKLLGQTLGLSPLAVLLGMLFWGFIWGSVGALLAVPLLMLAKIVLQNVPDLRWTVRWLEGVPVRRILRKGGNAPHVGLGAPKSSSVMTRAPGVPSP